MSYKRTAIISIILVAIFGVYFFHLKHSISLPKLSTQIKTTQADFELVWQDDFNGRTIDWSKWSKIDRNPPHWCRHMSKEDRLYDLRRGRLRLYCMRNDGWAKSDTAKVVTGGITTRDKFSFGFGKVEVRARMTSAMGCWPAIWIHSLERGDENPKRAEIDLLEHYNHDKIIHHTFHNYYNGYLKRQKREEYTFSHSVDVSKWNIYSVQILPDRLIMMVNDKVTAIYPKLQGSDVAGQFPFGTESFLLIDMQWANPWLKDLRPEQLPAWMDIDWVRVYKLR